MTTIRLPFPVSLNNAFVHDPRTGRRFKSTAYKRWQDDAIVLIRAARAAMVLPPVRIYLQFMPPDNRARDLDNLIKPVLDALVKAGLIYDDSSRFVRELTPVMLEPATPKRGVAPKRGTPQRKLRGYVDVLIVPFSAPETGGATPVPEGAAPPVGSRRLSAEKIARSTSRRSARTL